MKNKKTTALLLLLLLIPIAYLAIPSPQTSQLSRTTDPAPVSPPDQAPMPAAQPAKPFSATASHEGLPALFPPDEQPLDDRGRPLYKSGELLVRFKEGVSDADIEALHKSLGSTALGEMPRLRVAKGQTQAGSIRGGSNPAICRFPDGRVC
jgi:hypothetical protein